MSSQCQVKSNLHAMTYLFNSSNALFMITNSWTQFMSKDVPIYVHHMQPKFGQEIRNNLLSPVYHVYSLYCHPREQIYERVHMVLWLLFCKNICLESISVLHQNCSKTFPFPTEQVTIQCPQENSTKTTLKPKSSHFSLLFCQKVIFN